MTATEILKKWLSYVEYDPEQKSFNIMSVNYQFRKICDTVATFLPFDPEANLSVLYIKHRYEAALKELRLNALDVISNPDGLQPHVDMWKLLHSQEVDAIERTVLDALDVLVHKVMKVKQIGNRDLEAEQTALMSSVESVAESLHSCNVDLFLRGGPIGNITYFSTCIHVFERLADCLLTLEHSPDGIYLCYIRCGDSADGYFGFYIKSNGTILSVNERINESFPGEHSGRRNNRWAEDKKYTLFPYDFIFSYKDFDYKGYATSHVIDDEKLAFFNLSPQAYMPLVIAMMLLANRYSGTDITDMTIRYVDSLLPQNIARLDSNTQALIQAGGSSLVAAGTELSVNMTSEGTLAAQYAQDLQHAPEDKSRYKEYGHYPTGTNLFVELYGEGFQLDTSRLLAVNPHHEKQRKLLPSDIPATTRDNPEFVATERGMRVIAYKEAREQLAEYIRDRMLEEYTAIGGASSIRTWWEQQLQANKEKIFRLCIEAYKSHLKSHAEKPRYSTEELSATVCSFPYSYCDLNVGLYLNAINSCDVAPNITRKAYPFNEKIRTASGYGYTGKTRCPITGNTASIYFFFYMESWLDMERIVGKDNLPKILVGYEQRGHRGIGNSILNATDAVYEVGTPFEYHESCINTRLWDAERWKNHYRNSNVPQYWDRPAPPEALKESSVCYFNFCVGFSKRGFAKILKESEGKTLETL